MKKHFIYLYIFLFCTSCYKDEGNYDYQHLDEVAISLPAESFSIGLGEKLQITAIVDSKIASDDLSYSWEVYTRAASMGNTYQYHPFAEGAVLNQSINLSELMPSPATYSIRLHAKQRSTGRDFYSALASLSVTSTYSGLMVLHGDDSQSDIALIKDRDFLIKDGSIQTQVIPNLYSTVNKGKIAGKGKSIIQSYTYSLANIDRATVVAITDKEAVWSKYADFTKGGDWNSMFNPGINAGKPELYFTDDQVVYAVDNGKIFPRQNNTYSIFPIPSSSAGSFTVGSRYFKISGRAQGFFYDRALRGFVVTSNHTGFSSLSTSSFSQIATSSPFNIANMQADLLHLDRGGISNRFMAVMQEANGTKYLAELNWAASTNAGIAAAKYDMSVLPDINNAKFYAFGDNTAAMCYYGTGSKVYRYTALGGESLDGKFNELRMQNGSPINIDGEITMVKVLKPLLNNAGSFRVEYYNRNKILLVGSYKNNIGTLYSFTVSETTGDVIQAKQFTGLGKIHDADIKGL